MRRRHRDRDTGFTDLHPAETVHDPHVGHAEPAPGHSGDFLEDGQNHLLVSLVLKMADRLPGIVVSNHAGEDTKSPILRPGLRQGGDIDDLPGHTHPRAIARTAGQGLPVRCANRDFFCGHGLVPEAIISLMRAVAVRPGTPNSLHIRNDVPEPVPKPYEAVVRVHSAGFCATDLDLHQGLIGRAPEGSDYLVIGHENLGVVEHAPPGAKVKPGDLVISTLRRACGDYCRPCLTGEQDMCVTGNFEERGIVGLHGFMSDAYAEDTSYLVKVPSQLIETATLVEPLSILEKGIDHAMRIQSRFSWEPRKALVMGAGPVGILGAAALRMRGYDVIVASLEAEGGRKDKLLAEAGIRYVCVKTTSIAEITRGQDAQDIVIDASGSEQAVPAAIEALAHGGICILASVTRGSKAITLDIATMNRNIVLGNRVILGTVKAGRRHFEMAVRDLETIEMRHPGWLSNLITRRLPFDQALSAMTRAPEEIKTVLRFGL